MTDLPEEDPAAELVRLRESVRQLEAELAEQARHSAAAIASAQDRLYWLDRWHIDLNAVMARPVAQRAFAVARVLRGGQRTTTRLRRRWLA